MKTETQARRLKRILERSTFFRDMDDESYDILAGAMRERDFKEGHRVVQEGTDGEHLYIVEKGQLDVLRVNKKNGIEL